MPANNCRYTPEDWRNIWRFVFPMQVDGVRHNCLFQGLINFYNVSPVASYAKDGSVCQEEVCRMGLRQVATPWHGESTTP